MRLWVNQLGKRLGWWWSRRARTTRRLAHYLWQVIQNFNQYGTHQAAALSYYALFSLFPLVLLLAITVNRLAGPSVGAEQIRQGLLFFLPGDTVNLLQDNISIALDQVEEFTLVALIGLIWSALGFFSNLSSALDTIFRVPTSRSLWRQRLLAVGMLLVLVVLIGTSFITFGVLRLLTAAFLERPGIWVEIGVIFLPFSLNLVIFMLLFRYIPSIRVHWDAIWPAAIFGAAGWEIARGIFVWYVENFANYALVYGSIATVIVLLLSIYLTASLLILSAELCARLNEWLHEDEQPSKIVVEAASRQRSKLPMEGESTE